MRCIGFRWLDDDEEGPDEMALFTKREGFPTVDAFWRFLFQMYPRLDGDSDSYDPEYCVELQLIHWTDLRY